MPADLSAGPTPGLEDEHAPIQALGRTRSRHTYGYG